MLQLTIFKQAYLLMNFMLVKIYQNIILNERYFFDSNLDSNILFTTKLIDKNSLTLEDEFLKYFIHYANIK